MDTKTKKILLKSIPCGLYIVGIAHEKNSHFFLATWVSQSSINPPAISIGIRKSSFAYKCLENATSMSLNFFGKDDQNFIQKFLNKNISPTIAHTSQEVPILTKSIAYLEISHFEIYPTSGDHAIVFCVINNAKFQNEINAKNFNPIHLRDTPWSYGG